MRIIYSDLMRFLSYHPTPSNAVQNTCLQVTRSSQSFQRSPFSPSPQQKPPTASPAHPNTNPRIARHLEARHNWQQECSSWHKQKRRRQWRRCSRKRNRAEKHGPASKSAAYNHEPVEEDVQDVAVAGNVGDFAGEEDYRCEDHDGEE